MQQLTRLLDIMSKLRDPENGCPWDLKQDYKSLVPYTLEEAYEVAEAIELGDMNEVKKELGDLLFQVVFYAQLAKEEGLFDFDEIAGGIADKMVSRHPHVFSDHQYESEDAFLKAWEEQKEVEKAQEKMSKSEEHSEHFQSPENVSLMDGISKILPAMTRAVKIQKKATQVGFDWESAEHVLPVISEEIEELSTELKESERSLDRIEDELGDVLFSCVNLARKLKLDPEKALRMSNYKFSQRFRKMEQYYQSDRQQMEKASLEQMEQVWQSVKEVTQ
ncbi:MAG: nucleoside triphosphate pyrophosphohydrolase [Gammaproteobacteria bacterium]|nr:nucleoside triphosphate pyrophosphohydrolase [Gammaproteobacteria bacterium]